MLLAQLYPLIRPLLFSLSAERAHDVTLSALTMLDNTFKKRDFKPEKSHPITLMGCDFPNRVGLAAGLDKSGRCIDALRRLGFGFIEIGTITPQAQAGNPKPRVFRLPQSKALINRMGFNNVGIAGCLQNLKKVRYPGLLGINIGKNRDTPLASAVDDYTMAFNAVYPYADYITVNISSPNTPGLRELQKEEALEQLLTALKEQQIHCQQQQQRRVPLVVKIAPDITEEETAAMAKLFLNFEIDGVIATNTTNQRPDTLIGEHKGEQGGLSGQPVHALSCNVIQSLKAHLAGHIPIIGVGGIQSAEDAKQTMAAGAELIQLYTGLIYRGPQLVQDCISQC